MSGVIDWAAARARMIIAFILLCFAFGSFTYITLPKEGEPDIQIPILAISLPFSGISATDSERLIVKPMERELANVDGLKEMSSVAAEGYALVILEFEFNWDKTKVMADVRSLMKNVERDLPDGADTYSINEVTFSQFPIVVVSLNGNLPERTLSRVADDLADELKLLPSVLDVGIAGVRDEMIEVTIDPLDLEAYNITANELANAVRRNNRVIAAGDLKMEAGDFGMKVPSPLTNSTNVKNLLVTSNGNRLVTLGDLSDIKLTFADRENHSRYNGTPSIGLQIYKRKGFSVVQAVNEVKERFAHVQEQWPAQLQERVNVNFMLDNSIVVGNMVRQLEGSVMTAVILVMIVMLGALGTRASLLTGFAIPTTFLLTFILMGALGFTISNMVMFALILSVGMLVDGAIVVVEYAERRIAQGARPMRAYVAAGKRMLWPIVSSTATTLCAFLPMLFWPGVPGEFMKMLPTTLIFVFSSALVVALIFLPVIGGSTGRLSRAFEKLAEQLRHYRFGIRLGVCAFFIALTVLLAQTLLQWVLTPAFAREMGVLSALVGALLLILALIGNSIALRTIVPAREKKEAQADGKTRIARVMRFIVTKPLMPLASIILVVAFVVSVFSYYGKNGNGVEFFVETEPDVALFYIRARGNLSLEEKNDILRQVEEIILADAGVESVFTTAGEGGGLDTNNGGTQEPLDTIAQVQIELGLWEERPKVREKWFSFFGLFDVTREVIHPDYKGTAILARISEPLDALAGIKVESIRNGGGPSSSKPVGIRVNGENRAALLEAVERVSARFHAHPALIDIQDNRSLPGIDWHISVDIEKVGQYGADVATVGNMVQLVTNGVLLDSLRTEDLKDEVDIRVRFPKHDRLLSTLETLKLRTNRGLVPLTNFITITPEPKVGQIDRAERQRVYDIVAGVSETVMRAPDFAANGAEEIDEMRAPESQRPYTPTEITEELVEWIKQPGALPKGVSWKTIGDQEDQQESSAFLMKAFLGALGLMFIILLAQFNSFYNSFLVLLAVVLSSVGAMIGMLVMGQPFSVIMTGTGIVALAGIVVNNNIVLVDTYQEFAQKMKPLEAIVETVAVRARPVFLTSITTIVGLLPMMLGISINFADGGMSVDSPTALWWKQLATAVIFGLGIATILTLIFTPSVLALRIWFPTYIAWIFKALYYVPYFLYWSALLLYRRATSLSLPRSKG